MDQFRMDNTEGFTAAELAAMNDEYLHELQAMLADLPDGAEGASDWLIDEIKQNAATEILRRHDAA
jgi:hypothetical protein